MALPLQDTNVVGSQCFSLTDLALQSSMASATSQDSTQFSTGVPATVLVLATLASGQAVVKLKVGTSSTISMTSGTTDVTALGTTPVYNKINTTSSNLFARVRLTDSNWSCAFTDLTVFVLYGLTAGETWPHLRSAAPNAVASSKTGDGSGVVSMSPA